MNSGSTYGDTDGTTSSTIHADPGTVLVVRLGETEFGLPVSGVREVLRARVVSRVPFPPPHVCGVISLRGLVIPVVDLGERLLSRPSVRPGTFVVAHEPDTHEPIALLVDVVTRLLDTASATRLEPPAEAEATLPPGWIESVIVPDHGGGPITVLDLRMILPNSASPGPT